MNNTINYILKELDLFDYPKLLKDKFLKNPIQKKLEIKRYDFYRQFVKEGDLCFDIGASYGNRTEVFLKLGAKVVTIEPQPIPAKFLKRKFKDKIILEEKALGANPGKSIMYISSKNSALSSLSNEWISKVSNKRFNKISWDKEKEVEVITLDYLVKKYGKPNFCKIDVEGFELDVLKGLSKPIEIISFEYTIPEFIDRAIECVNYLSKLSPIECNFSPGETMELALKNWETPEMFVDLFKTLPSRGIIDGDIYIKTTTM